MTRTDDPRLGGRWPEFARMSLRPGIGLDAMHEFASELMRYDLDVTQEDVPNTLRHGSKELPLGRYLRGNLRLMCGKEKNAPEGGLLEYKAEMRALLEAAKVDPEAPTLRQQIVKKYGGRVKSLEGRQKIFKERRVL